MEQPLVAQQRVKSFGEQRAVDRIDMSIPTGATHGIGYLGVSLLARRA